MFKKISTMVRDMQINTVHEYYRKYCMKKNTNMTPTIISQNCIGGCIYNDLGLKFYSPTINLFIEGNNFVKLIYNLDEYMSIPAIPAGCKNSGGRKDCPIIKIGDIYVNALHYVNDIEAANDWNRRRHRIHLDNVFVISNVWNLNDNIDYIEKIDSCNYPSIIFSDYKYNYKSIFPLSANRYSRDSRNILRPNLTDYNLVGLRNFEMIFDFVKWFNEGEVGDDSCRFVTQYESCVRYLI